MHLCLFLGFLEIIIQCVIEFLTKETHIGVLVRIYRVGLSLDS